MNIQKIRLHNYKCFEDSTFEFNPQFTVLVGDNGKGKSAILDALAISAGSLFVGTNDAIKPRLIQKDEIRLKDFGDHIEPQLPVDISTKGLISLVEGNWRRSLKSVTTEKIDTGGLNFITHTFLQDAKKARSGEDVSLPIIAYYGTNRLWLNRDHDRTIETHTRGSRLELGYKNSLDASTNSKGFLSWMKTAELTFLQKKRENPAYEAVKKAIANCVDEW